MDKSARYLQYRLYGFTLKYTYIKGIEFWLQILIF